MTARNVITPWSFRDGRDYVVSLSVCDDFSSLSIKISDRITAEEWSCSYDAQYVENLTQRTGSYKPFDVFVSMIKSAILKKSESVSLELMNIEDLELLRNQKLRSRSVIAAADSKSGISQKSSILSHQPLSSSTSVNNNKSEALNSKKKYLIVTYVAEFDKVHYPIPLDYSGAPDPMIMQSSIKKLKSEVVALRNAKSALEEEVLMLKTSSCNTFTGKPNGISNRPISALSLSKSSQRHIHSHSQPAEYNQNTHPNPNETDEDEKYKNYGEKHSADLEDGSKLNTLISISRRVKELEKELKKERTDHQVRIEKLQAENEFLCLKLEAAEKHGFELKTEIHHLETQLLTVQEGINSYHNDKRAANNSSSNAKSSPYACRDRDGYQQNGGRGAIIRSRNNSKGNNRTSSNRSGDTYLKKGRSSSTESFASNSNDNANNLGKSQRSYHSYRRGISNSRSENATGARFQRGRSPTLFPFRNRSVSSVLTSDVSRSRLSPSPSPKRRSNSFSPARAPFNPTAYVTQKRDKQEKMAQLRLERVQSRLRAHSTGFSTDNWDRGLKSRSRSRDSVESGSTSRTVILNRARTDYFNGLKGQPEGAKTFHETTRSSRKQYQELSMSASPRHAYDNLPAKPTSANERNSSSPIMDMHGDGGYRKSTSAGIKRPSLIPSPRSRDKDTTSKRFEVTQVPVKGSDPNVNSAGLNATSNWRSAEERRDDDINEEKYIPATLQKSKANNNALSNSIKKISDNSRNIRNNTAPITSNKREIRVNKDALT